MLNVFKNTAICLAFGLLYTANTSYAANELLAQTELNRNGEKVTAELWANPIKGGYMDELTVIFKRQDKSVITAHKPTINGGYNSLLKPVKVIDKDGDEQLLLSVGRGTWNVPSDFRILDYDKKGKVTEIFGGKESLGIIVNAKIDQKNLILNLKNGEEKNIKINRTLDDSEVNRVVFDNVFSLTPYDFDKDGLEELFLTQEIRARRNLIMDVGYMLKYDKESKSWNESMITLMSNSTDNKHNTVNDGRAFSLGMFMPRKIVLPFGEGTYPEFATKGVEKENKVNKLLKKELDNYISKVFDGSEDLAFNMLRADEKLWTIQIINGKKDFGHHHVNINPNSCELVKLSSILDVKNKKLLQCMKDICKDSKAKFQGTIPDEWYIIGNDLYLRQKDAEGKEEALVFSLESLNEFILDKKWKVEPKEDSKAEDKKEETAEEKFWKKLIGEDTNVEKSDEKSANEVSKEDKNESKTQAVKTKKGKNKKLTDELVKTKNESNVEKIEEKKP